MIHLLQLCRERRVREERVEVGPRLALDRLVRRVGQGEEVVDWDKPALEAAREQLGGAAGPENVRGRLEREAGNDEPHARRGRAARRQQPVALGPHGIACEVERVGRRGRARGDERRNLVERGAQQLGEAGHEVDVVLEHDGERRRAELANAAPHGEVRERAAHLAPLELAVEEAVVGADQSPAGVEGHFAPPQLLGVEVAPVDRLKNLRSTQACLDHTRECG